MNKFKTLIRKDWIISKKTLLMPFWITAGFYLLIILGTVIAYYKGDVQGNLFDFPTDIPINAISYIANLSVVGLPGLMSIIFTIMLMQGALNEDIRRNCELFHRSQPVSIWLRTGSKFYVGLLGNWIVLFLITLFTFIVINIILAIIHQFNFYVAISGMLQALTAFIKTGLIVGSFTFFCSAIFKDKAFLKGLSIIVAVHFLFLIFNSLFGWKLPLPLTYLLKLVTIDTGQRILVGIDEFEALNLIKNAWNSILFNWKTLYQVLFSGALFAGATLIYKNKEIK